MYEIVRYFVYRTIFCVSQSGKTKKTYSNKFAKPAPKKGGSILTYVNTLIDSQVYEYVLVSNQ